MTEENKVGTEEVLEEDVTANAEAEGEGKESGKSKKEDKKLKKENAALTERVEALEKSNKELMAFGRKNVTVYVLD